MNYKKHYDILINRAKNRLTEGYLENHHIIPKCMGGDDSNDNLVKLTGREHFVAHILLVKIYPDVSGLIYAVNSMCRFNKKMDRSKNRMYGWIRELYAKEVSEANSQKQKGNKNSQYGKRWISNVNTKETKSIKKEELDSYIKCGWILGRNKKLIKCKQCNKPFIKMNKTKFCSNKCRSDNIRRPNIVADNFTELYAEYIKTGSFYKAFKNLGIGYNNNVYDRFKEEIKKHANVA